MNSEEIKSEKNKISINMTGIKLVKEIIEEYEIALLRNKNILNQVNIAKNMSQSPLARLKQLSFRKIL